MSKKVIIIWSIAIVLFLFLGLFGLLNKNIIEDNVGKDIEINTSILKCEAKENDKEIKYQFKVSRDGNIEITNVTYTSLNNNDKEYAQSIKNLNIDGLIIDFKENESGYSINLNLDYKKFPYETTVGTDSLFSTLKIPLSNASNCQRFIGEIRKVYSNLTCN